MDELLGQCYRFENKPITRGMSVPTWNKMAAIRLSVCCIGDCDLRSVVDGGYDTSTRLLELKVGEIMV